MSARREVGYWVAQRATAVILAICVAVHLATMIYAVNRGLTAGEILGRTRASVGWAAFYSIFVVAAAVHGAIGLRGVAAEWLGLRGAISEALTAIVGVLLVVAGMRAVIAVVAA